MTTDAANSRKDRPMTIDLHSALRTLNDAAYAALRAGRDTTMHPDLDRRFLREIAAATDKLVDDNAPTIGKKGQRHDG